MEVEMQEAQKELADEEAKKKNDFISFASSKMKVSSVLKFYGILIRRMRSL